MFATLQSIGADEDDFETRKETLVLLFFHKLKLETDVFKNVYSGIMDTFVVSTDFCENPRLLKTILPKVIDQEKKIVLIR